MFKGRVREGKVVSAFKANGMKHRLNDGFRGRVHQTYDEDDYSDKRFNIFFLTKL